MAQIISLSAIEQTKLTDLESVIEAGLKTFYEVGNALAQIREERLYRVDFDTFEDYCRERWQMSRAYAYRMIGAAEVVENLSPIGDIKPPANEAQARPLTGLDPEQQREAWLKASESAEGGRMTAAQVQTAVDEVTENWKSVWELQMSVGDWARKKYGESEYGLERLNTLKQNKDEDLLWDEVVAVLPTPYLKLDVIQAINNVIDIWQQRAKERQAHESPELTCAGQVRHWMRYQGRSADDLREMVDRPGTCWGWWDNLIRIRPDGKTTEDMETAVLQVLAEDFDIERERVNHARPDTRPNLQVFAAVKQLRDRGFVVVGLPAEEGPLRYSIDDSDWLEPAQVWDFLQNVLNEEQTAVSGPQRLAQERLEKRGGLSKADYAALLVPELVKFLRTYQDKHGRTWRQISSVAAHTSSTPWQDITREWNRRGIYYEDDVLKDAIKRALRWLKRNETETAISESSPPADVPYADYLDAQIKATDAEMEQLLADGLPEPEPLGLLDDEPLEISTIDNGLKQIEWLITELLANVRGAGYISVLGKLAEANMAILDARKLLKEVTT